MLKVGLFIGVALVLVSAEASAQMRTQEGGGGENACCYANTYYMECSNMYCDTQRCVCQGYFATGCGWRYTFCISNGSNCSATARYCCCDGGITMLQSPFRGFDDDAIGDIRRSRSSFVAMNANMSVDMSHFVSGCMPAFMPNLAKTFRLMAA